MRSQNRRLPPQWYQTDAAIQRAQDILNTKGLSLPCKITAINGQLITVAFQVAGISIPNITVPIAQSVYNQQPLSVGDMGLVVSGDAALANISGQTDTMPGMKTQGNLGALLFIPVSNKTWANKPVDQYLIQSPNTIQIQSQDNSVSITLTKGNNVEVKVGNTTLTVNSNGVSIQGNLTVSGDVKAGNISLQNHVHPGVQSGNSNTQAPQG